jgi:hypothetical protein
MNTIFAMSTPPNQHLPVDSTTHFSSSEEVAQRLSKAWEFLSGKKGMFDYFIKSVEKPEFVDFSVFMPMDVEAEKRTAGVGVLIHREDATVVASHMFGLDKCYLTEEDLRDACAEVCNVFSGCIPSEMFSKSDVGIGLPKVATPGDFDFISKKSVLNFTYGSGDSIKTISVLIYGIFTPPESAE